MREITLDTETTGLDPKRGDRVFEIGCVELVNQMPTGETFHVYIDPERPLSQASIDITGVTDDQLVGKPTFARILPAFLDFLGDAKLVIHNASFDVGFLNMEFGREGAPPLNPDRIVDTLAMARKRFPGAQANLDALCRRFGVDNSGREKHGALLDAELLAEVYLELKGGRQPGLTLAGAGPRRKVEASASSEAAARPPQPKLLTPEEEATHATFVATLGENAAWYSTGIVARPDKENA